MTQSHFENELVQVQKIVVNELLHLSHVEPHLAPIAGHQVRTEQESLGLQQLDIVDFVLLDDEMPLLLQVDLLLLDQLDPCGQKLVDLGVYTQFDLLGVFYRVTDELHPHEIVEEHPLVRMELCYLHQRYHLYQFQGCPMLIQLVLFGRGVESFVQ